MSTVNNLEAKVNQVFSFSSQELEGIDFLAIDEHHFHILHKQQTYHAKLIESNYDKKTFTISISGSNYTVELSDRYDQLVEQLGLNVQPILTALDIKAPMPGLVLDILVEEGQEVEEGTPILILEAMKMENVLKAAAPGIVESILVKKSTAVEKNQLLVKCV